MKLQFRVTQGIPVRARMTPEAAALMDRILGKETEPPDEKYLADLESVVPPPPAMFERKTARHAARPVINGVPAPPAMVFERPEPEPDHSPAGCLRDNSQPVGTFENPRNIFKELRNERR